MEGHQLGKYSLLKTARDRLLHASLVITLYIRWKREFWSEVVGESKVSLCIASFNFSLQAVNESGSPGSWGRRRAGCFVACTLALEVSQPDSVRWWLNSTGLFSLVLDVRHASAICCTWRNEEPDLNAFVVGLSSCSPALGTAEEILIVQHRLN